MFEADCLSKLFGTKELGKLLTIGQRKIDKHLNVVKIISTL